MAPEESRINVLSGGDTPGRHGFERFLDAGAGYRPLGLEPRPQLLQRVAAAQPGDRQHAQIEKSAEECGEKHHLGKDEPAHRPAERAIDLVVEQSALALPDNRAEPAHQHVDEHGETGCQDIPAGGGFVEAQYGAKRQEKQRRRSDDGPVRWGGKVIARGIRGHDYATPFLREASLLLLFEL